jgi:hypothetical protein
MAKNTDTTKRTPAPDRSDRGRDESERNDVADGDVVGRSEDDEEFEDDEDDSDESEDETDEETS